MKSVGEGFFDEEDVAAMGITLATDGGVPAADRSPSN